MQILVKVKNGDSIQRARLTPHPGKEDQLATPLRIWRDMKTTPAMAGSDLRRWKAIRRGERFTGSSNDEGPRLADGDEVTFVVSRAGH